MTTLYQDRNVVFVLWEVIDSFGVFPKVFARDQYSIENLFRYDSMRGHQIATKFHTYEDKTAVMSRWSFLSDHVSLEFGNG